MNTFGQFSIKFFFFLSLPTFVWSTALAPNLSRVGVLGPENNNRMIPEENYEKFSGRVVDRDEASRIFKIKVENNNTKFFRSGDIVFFKINLKEDEESCKGFVKTVEDFYFTILVDRLETCFDKFKYFRRGTVLNIESKDLSRRIFEASQYRDQLILRKQDFLKQLNDINHFIWTFDQQKVKTTAGFDQQINQIQREKRRALDELINLKHERLVLQNELMKKLNELDESLQFYRVERQEKMVDRWELDHDLGLPVGQRPQEIKKE